MKKHIVIISLLALCIWSISAILAVKAQEDDVLTNVVAEEIAQEEEVSYQELETETPKLLPNNPFHFVKRWGWGIRRIFTFNPVKRAELELKIANEQVAEIKRLEEVAPDNTKAIERASDNYHRNVERLRNRLEALKETSENPNVDKLLDKLTNRSLKHQRLFDNLKVKLEKHPELKEKFENIKNRIDDVIVRIPEKFENAEKFKNRIQRIIDKQPKRIFKELRAVEFLDRIEVKLPEDKKEYLQNLKEEVISKFENKAQKWSEVDKKKFLKHEIIKRLPGDNLRRINILEKIGEKTTDSSFRTRIQGVKKGLLEREVSSKAGRERVLKLISQAKTLIAKVKNLLSDKPNTKATELLKRAKEHLAKAEHALNVDKIGEAFGQANSAISNAKNALRHIRQNDATGAGDGTNIIKPTPICIQVITPAISPRGVCKNFPTPCDVPSTWKKVSKCPRAVMPSTGAQNTTNVGNAQD